VHQFFSRRNLLKTAPCGLPWASGILAAPPARPGAADTFPLQSPAMVREMVIVSHGNMKRVRELVEAHPALAKAAIDWGFGDWETALGAASHTGHREIAELLISHGARPSLFSATMLGQLEVVKAFVGAEPGAQSIPGPHSISLLAHAKVGGAQAEAVLKYLESLGDAGTPPEVPLTDEDLAALKGFYRFGSGTTEAIEISEVSKQLLFTRLGTTGRGLIHLGKRTFHPAGPSAVRVWFATGEGQMVLTVHDPEVILTARRVAVGAVDGNRGIQE
jgi:hypothetical protein